MPGRWAEQVSVDPEKTWDSFIQFPYVFGWSAGDFPNDPAASTCSTGGLNCRVLSCLSAFEVRTQRLQWAQSGRKWRVNDFCCENGHQNGSKWPLSLGKWKWTSWFLQMSMNFPSIFRQTYLMTSGLSLQQAGREWSGTKPKLGNEGLHKRHCLCLGPSKAIIINHHQTGYALVQHGA